MNNTTATVDRRWLGLFRLGSTAALIVAALLVGEVVVYAMFPRPATAAEHLALFRDNWLVGLLTLDLLGMISYLLLIPTMLALYIALRRANESLMAVAGILFLVGIADFFATNNAFAILAISQEHAAATNDADRAMFLAAGQAMFTMFNENAFLVSYVLVSASWALISGVMLKSDSFGRGIAVAGLLAGVAGIVAVILEHVPGSKALLSVAISFYFAAIVLLFFWVVLVGRRLRQLAVSVNRLPLGEKSSPPG